MINERVFSSQFTNFWRSALPNLESVLRALNLGYDRIEPPVRGSDPRRRDIISETGFRLFQLAMAGRDYSADTVEQAGRSAGAFLGTTPKPFSAMEMEEVIEISRRLRRYSSALPGEVRVAPAFRGHGMMSPCNGDISIGNVIVEVKYVDRSFRSTDLRQAICYCGLKYLSDGDIFEEVSIFNPLRGTAIQIKVQELISSASGRAAEEFFQDFSYVLSSGEISR